MTAFLLMFAFYCKRLRLKKQPAPQDCSKALRGAETELARHQVDPMACRMAYQPMPL